MEDDIGDSAVPNKFNVFLVFLFPALGGLLFGYDIGATSFIVQQISDRDHAGVDWSKEVHNSALLQGVIMSGAVAGAFAASLVIFHLSDLLGRRREMLVAAFLYTIGGLVEASSYSVTTAQGVAVLCLGRFIFGLGCGIATHAGPMYIAEMVPAKLRGVLVSSNEAMMCLGMTIGYTIGDLNKSITGGWKYTYLISSYIGIAYGIGVWCLPPSMRWLVLQKRFKDTLESAQFVYKSGAQKVQLSIICKAQMHDSSILDRIGRHGIQRPIYVLFSRRVFPATLVAAGLATLQQTTGQPSVLYYAAEIFKDAGVFSYATISIAAFKLICTILSSMIIESSGRRLTLLVGTTTMLTSLCVITSFFLFDWTNKWIFVVSMFLYVGGYQLGFGPVTWLLISEIFPLEIRGEGIAFATQINFFWNLVIAMSFSDEIHLFGDSTTFGIFTMITSASVIFVFTFVPETRGRELEDIEDMLDSGTFFPAPCCCGVVELNDEPSDTSWRHTFRGKKQEEEPFLKSSSTGNLAFQD